MIRSLFLSVPFSLAACAVDDAGPTQVNTTMARHASDGTPEGIGVLDLLDDPATTLQVLDDLVPLDVRAARNLVARRDGPDGVYGTADDQPFESIQDVDDVKYVGPSALDRLEAYAELNGYVPQGSELLGTWDNVAFTVDEATAVLDLVNTASEPVLDDDVGLDSRAVRSILDARDVPSVLVLSELYYVGQSALTKLRGFEVHEPVSEGTPAGDDCLETSECADGLSCMGRPHDDAHEFGKCVDLNQGDDMGQECDTDADCGEDTVCMGDIAYGSGIFCVSAWQEGTFSNLMGASIPDSGSVESELVVYGLASVPVDVVLTIDIDHDAPDQLEYQLYNFNGYETSVQDLDGDLVDGKEIVVWAFPSDDAVNGTYTLVVTDTQAGTTGTLDGWFLTITSTFD
jgi:hypothetical protein